MITLFLAYASGWIVRLSGDVMKHGRLAAALGLWLLACAMMFSAGYLVAK
jgi:hypothetical protein